MAMDLNELRSKAEALADLVRTCNVKAEELREAGAAVEFIAEGPTDRIGLDVEVTFILAGT